MLLFGIYLSILKISENQPLINGQNLQEISNLVTLSSTKTQKFSQKLTSIILRNWSRAAKIDSDGTKVRPQNKARLSGN
jgi:hypothetical protein